MTSPYGYRHKQARERLLPRAYGKPCPLCGKPMSRGQRLHLDHSTPLALGGTTGDRIVHGWCNESAGAATRESIRNRPINSQQW